MNRSAAAKPILRLTIALLIGGASSGTFAQQPDRGDLLRQAFDGAMTCSAVAAIKADEVAPDERWRWENRSFAFGMLATQFWTEARGQAMPAEELTKALNTYASALLEMVPLSRAGFEANCESRYADMDTVCESNPCPHKPPPAGDAASGDSASDAAP